MDDPQEQAVHLFKSERARDLAMPSPRGGVWTYVFETNATEVYVNGQWLTIGAQRG